MILVLSDDLIDFSKVSAAGRAHGIAVRKCSSITELEAAVTDATTLIVLDLHFPRLDVAAMVAKGKPVLGYGSHVHAATLKTARESGAVAMPRSKFFEELDSVLIASQPSREG